MYKDAVASYAITKKLTEIGVVDDSTLFVWLESASNEQNVTVRRHDIAKNIEQCIPAYTADELSRILGRICYSTSNYLALNINSATDKFSDVLAETLADAVIGGSVSLDLIKKCLGKENPLDSVRITQHRFTPEAHKQMFQIVFDYTGENRYSESKLVGEYTVAFTQYQTSDVMFIAVGSHKQAVVVRTEKGDISFPEGTDATLSAVANLIVNTNKGE